MPPFERIDSKSCCLAVKSSWRFFFHEIELNESRPKTTSFSRIKHWIFPIPRLVTKLFTRNSLFTALEEWFYETCGVHFSVCKLLSTNISPHMISTKISEGVSLSSVHKTQQGPSWHQVKYWGCWRDIWRAPTFYYCFDVCRRPSLWLVHYILNILQSQTFMSRTWSEMTEWWSTYFMLIEINANQLN